MTVEAMHARRAPHAVALPNDQEASGRSFGDEELRLLEEVIRSGTLTSTKGTMVRTLEARFAEIIGSAHVRGCSSGTAAVHAAVVAVDPEPGDEIVTSPITDMGALAPILYQTAIPVFADVDPVTGNLTAETVDRVVSDRTRAIIVTHLFGNPADVDGIMAVAARWGIPVIEDCAQAYLADTSARKVGTIGAIGCFSLQQGKHITSGEGGLVVTGDEGLSRRIRLWIDKAWPYGEPSPDHEFLALNGRMSELQGAVALAQMGQLERGVAQRIRMAEALGESLKGLSGVVVPGAREESRHVFWRYPLLIDPAVVAGGAVGVAADLREFGIGSAPRYIQKPAFACKVFADQRTFGDSRFPFSLARPEALDYDPSRFPGTFRYLDQVLVLPWNERFERVHVDAVAEAITRSVLARTGAR